MKTCWETSSKEHLYGDICKGSHRKRRENCNFLQRNNLESEKKLNAQARLVIRAMFAVRMPLFSGTAHPTRIRRRKMDNTTMSQEACPCSQTSDLGETSCLCSNDIFASTQRESNTKDHPARKHLIMERQATFRVTPRRHPAPP